MARDKKTSKGQKNTFSQKRERGRPPKLPFDDITGRAGNNRRILDQVWERLWPLLSMANSEEEVTKAFEEGARPYAAEFVPSLSALALKVLREKTFPKRRKPRINFLADSLAGVGIVRPRRSRDICAEERAKDQRKHHIIRYEYYVECSCGYEGPSKDRACRNCGAEIPASLFG